MVDQTRIDAHQVVAEVLWSQAFNRDKQAVVKANNLAFKVVAALKREGLITGTSQADAEEILKKYGRTHDEPPVRGISHLVAEALVLLSLPLVHRDTVRALMPEAAAKAGKNTINMQFGRALRKFNGWKWIDRRDDGTIAVLNRDALVEWFSAAQDLNDYRAATTLDLVGAAARLKTDLTGGHDEIRRRELLAIKRLMESAAGAITNERGTVRAVPKSRAL